MVINNLNNKIMIMYNYYSRREDLLCLCFLLSIINLSHLPSPLPTPPPPPSLPPPLLPHTHHLPHTFPHTLHACTCHHHTRHTTCTAHAHTRSSLFSFTPLHTSPPPSLCLLPSHTTHTPHLPHTCTHALPFCSTMVPSPLTHYIWPSAHHLARVTRYISARAFLPPPAYGAVPCLLLPTPLVALLPRRRFCSVRTTLDTLCAFAFWFVNGLRRACTRAAPLRAGRTPASPHSTIPLPSSSISLSCYLPTPSLPPPPTYTNTVLTRHRCLFWFLCAYLVCDVTLALWLGIVAW